MRIISGTLKGRIIKFPKSKLVRPTTDRVKESIFNYLANIIDFEGISACDLYAGSGSLGLEAISRGAASSHFVEKNYKVATVLRENIESLAAKPYARVFQKSCIRFTSQPCEEPYNLILADPPFFKNDIYQVITNIRDNKFLSEGGIILIERSVQTEEEDKVNFGIEPAKKMGDSLIYIFDYAVLYN